MNTSYKRSSSYLPGMTILIPLPKVPKRQRARKKESQAADMDAREQESGAEATSSTYELVAKFQFVNNGATEFHAIASMQFWAGDPENFTVVSEETEEAEAAKFLDSLYGLTAAGKEDEAIDEVIDRFDDLLTKKDLQLCNNIFQLADIKSIATSVSLAILSMTVVEKSALVKRAAFASRLRLTLVKSRGPKEAAELLAGLQ